jgi:hypothetical protein
MAEQAQPLAQQQQVAPQPPAIAVLPRPINVRTPEVFDGTRTRLSAFLTQLRLYFGFHVDQFPANNPVQKILFTASYLAGGAYEWFEGYLVDYLENPNDADEREDETNEIFATWAAFQERLERTFGDLDKTRTATRKLLGTRQETSVGDYTAKFQKYAHQTEWDDNALRDRFYEGLKERVKDDIARAERPETLQEMIELATKIDNRQYERQLERKGEYHHGRGKKPQHRPSRPYYGPQPMEIDSTQKYGTLSKQERQRRFKNKLCLYCGKAGHVAKNCRSKGQANSTEKTKQQTPPRPFHVGRDRPRGQRTPRTVNTMIRVPTPSPEVDDIMEEWQEPDTTENFEDEETEEIFGSLLEEWHTPRQQPEQRSEEVTDELELEPIEPEVPRETESIWTLDTAWKRHASLHWTFCFDHRCQIHDSAKQFDPRPSRARECTAGYWTNCRNDDCDFHVRDKIYHEWYPQEPKTPCAARYWMMCQDSKCYEHLPDKRARRLFPGPDTKVRRRQIFPGPDSNARGQQIQEQLVCNCNQDDWEYCFDSYCSEHLLNKMKAGFVPHANPKNF